MTINMDESKILHNDKNVCECNSFSQMDLPILEGSEVFSLTGSAEVSWEWQDTSEHCPSSGKIGKTQYIHKNM